MGAAIAGFFLPTVALLAAKIVWFLIKAVGIVWVAVFAIEDF
jgi:hypothetical protein